MDVDVHSERENAEERVFTAVEETLSMLKFYSESSTYWPLKELQDMFKEAFVTIEGLQKQIEENVKTPEPSPAEDPPSMKVILQEIKKIKATVAQIQSPKNILAPTWAEVAEKGISVAKVRIEDEMEKQEIAEMSSEQLVKRIGREEIIGARQMGNGQIKVYFSGQDTQRSMIEKREWAHKLSSTSHVAIPSYQVLIHDVPLTFNPENPEQIKELQQTNNKYLQDTTIHKAV
ncbi:hypothetical protein K3495_g13453 [Podosphaera aphanis]|nr:hypothetical protein K3495_g13453 [Podosphaera aphanis]